MNYAITTLEIEIARIELALRKARSTTFSYEDSRGGHMPDFWELEGRVRELKEAIEVLREWEKTNTEEAAKLRDKFNIDFSDEKE